MSALHELIKCRRGWRRDVRAVQYQGVSMMRIASSVVSLTVLVLLPTAGLQGCSSGDSESPGNVAGSQSTGTGGRASAVGGSSSNGGAGNHVNAGSGGTNMSTGGTNSEAGAGNGNE